MLPAQGQYYQDHGIRTFYRDKVIRICYGTIWPGLGHYYLLQDNVIRTMISGRVTRTMLSGRVNRTILPGLGQYYLLPGPIQSYKSPD